MSDKKLLLALFGPKCVTEVVYGNFTLLIAREGDPTVIELQTPQKRITVFEK